MATLDQVVNQMLDAGLPPLPPGHPLFDGAIHRFGPRRKAWYVLREWPARNGKRYIVGAFGIWQGAENNAIPVKADFTGMDVDEYRGLQRSLVAQETKAREKRALRAGNASNRARQQWLAGRAKLAPGEALPPYLERKRLQWESGLRVWADGTLLVPIIRYDVTEEQESDPDYKGPRRLVGLQKIRPDGEKLFNKGMDPIGGAFRFGPKKPKDGELFLIGEGFATVASVHQGFERVYTSYAAFNTGNLLPFAKILRSLFPNSPFLFLADDDAYLEAYINKRLREDYGVRELYKILDGEKTYKGRDGPVTVHAQIHEDGKGTPVITAGIRTPFADAQAPGGEREKLRTFVIPCPGRAKAWEAAGVVGNAWVVWPKFADRKLHLDAGLDAYDGLPAGPGRITDFNDLHGAEGIGKVVEQVAEAIRAIEDAHEIARAIRDGAPPRPKEAAGAGDDGKGGKGADDEPDWQLHGSFLRRFTQVYPSDVAFDAELGTLVKIEHMRLRFTSKPVSMWLASPRKRVINAEQLVFDPTGKADPKTTVNLFRGIEAKPKPGSCKKLLELIHYLCGEHEEDTETPVTSWVLRWAAYPLQHPGTKMQTAVVMHGEEGTGKNLFWGAVCEIFGRYGAMITQSELEDRFNGWESAKLFIIANEVVTRQEMSHQVGRLKNMITEPYVYINLKNQQQRYERNHMNMVFLSNELQAMKIGPRDRRFMVVRTPNERPAQFYEEVAAELAAGGVAALYQHLLELDLADFKPYTKPLMTAAKEAMIEYGLLPSQLFWRELHDGVLGLPYCPALTTDVFRAYTVWCARNNHKMPEASNKFTPNFMSLNGVRRVEKRVPEPGKVAEMALVGTSKEAELRMRRVFVMGAPAPKDAEETRRIVHGVLEFRRALLEFLKEDPFFGAGRERGREASQEEAF